MCDVTLTGPLHGDQNLPCPSLQLCTAFTWCISTPGTSCGPPALLLAPLGQLLPGPLVALYSSSISLLVIIYLLSHGTGLQIHRLLIWVNRVTGTGSMTTSLFRKAQYMASNFCPSGIEHGDKKGDFLHQKCMGNFWTAEVVQRPLEPQRGCQNLCMKELGKALPGVLADSHLDSF